MYAYILLVLCVSDFCLSDRNLFPPLPVAPVTSKNEFCKTDSVSYVDNLDNLTLWSYQMWDASAKSTTGVLQGSKFHMGDWDECMKVKAPFKTQFCLVIVNANIHDVEPLHDPYALERDPQGSVLKRIVKTNDASQLSRDTVSIGWCVPASCTLQDLNDTLNEHLNHSKTLLIEHNVTYSGMVMENLCQTQGEVKSFGLLDSVFCTILAMFLLVVVIATIYDSKIEEQSTQKEKDERQKHIGHRILIGFSARRNFVNLARADESNPALSCLYGLRTISIIPVVIGHRFILINIGPVLNSDDIETGYRNIPTRMMFHLDVFVDTFFIISGVLVTYGLMIQFKKKYVNPLYIILLRYMRLTPIYAFVILYYATVFYYTGTGPLWKTIAQVLSERCKNSWWTNLLYINTYVNTENLCMIESWYLTCDYHFYIIAIFVVLLLSKNKRLGSLLFILYFILSMAIPFIITVVYKRPGLTKWLPDLFLDPLHHTDFIMSYIKSHTRATPYCIGMMTGYVYYKIKEKDNKMQLSKLKSHCVTLISMLLLIIAIASALPFYNPYHEYNILEAGVYAGFNRLTWSFGIVGILLTASFGHATIIQKILSWSPFVPLSKLVYGAYLIHMSVQYKTTAMMLTPQRFDLITLFWMGLGDCFASFIASLFLYLLIEIPIIKLFRELTNPLRNEVSPPELRSTQENINVNKYIERTNDSRL